MDSFLENSKFCLKYNMDHNKNQFQINYLKKLLLNDIQLREEISKLPLDTLKMHTGVLAYLDKYDYSSLYKHLCKPSPTSKIKKACKLKKKSSKSFEVTSNRYNDALNEKDCQANHICIELNPTSDYAQKSNSATSVPSLAITETNTKSVSLSEIEELLNENWSNLKISNDKIADIEIKHNLTTANDEKLHLPNIERMKTTNSAHLSTWYENNTQEFKTGPSNNSKEQIVPQFKFELTKKVITKPRKVRILDNREQFFNTHDKATWNQNVQQKNVNNSNNSKFHRRFKINTRHYRHGRHTRREFFYTIN